MCWVSEVKDQNYNILIYTICLFYNSYVNMFIGFQIIYCLYSLVLLITELMALIWRSVCKSGHSSVTYIFNDT